MPSTTSSTPSGFTGDMLSTATSGVSSWREHRACDSQDAATITTPGSSIGTTIVPFVREPRDGTYLVLRLKYDDGLTSITNPVVKVFGADSLAGPWAIVRNKANSLTATLTTATATDAQDGTFSYTTPDNDNHWFDCCNYKYLVVGVETALAGTGTVTTARIEGRLV